MSKFILCLLMACLTLILAGQEVIQFKNGNYTPESALFYSFAGKDIRSGSDIYLGIQIRSASDLELIQAAIPSIKIASVFDQHNYVVAIPNDVANKLPLLKEVVALFDVPYWAKLERTLFQSPDRRGQVRIMAYGSDGHKRFMVDFPNIGLSEILPGSQNVYFTADLDSATMPAAAEKDYVAYISVRPKEMDTLNFVKRSIESVQGVNLSVADGGLGFNGLGITVGHGDAGQVAHIDLIDRINNFSAYPEANHAVHTAGTIGGAGFLNPKHRGIADQVQFLVHDGYNIILNAPSLYAGNQMRVTNNSYATIELPITCEQLRDYNTYSIEVDDQAIQFADLLHVWASGNYGQLTCPPYNTGLGTIASGPQCSKNGISVNAISSSEFYNLPEFTSRGPTEDGRLKPEISSIGSLTLSTGTNNSYFSTNGTSMAAPSVTGATALVQEAYRASHGGTYPTSDLIKAILINTSDELGPEGPEYRHGYGKLNIYKAVQHANTGEHILAQVTQGQEHTYNITVPAGVSRLCVTLAWIDPPGNPSMSKQLINDLDLEMSGPGNVWQPWVLNPDPAHSHDAAQRGKDDLNNLEQISILNPVPGTYTIKVKGYAVIGIQNYALTYRHDARKIKVQAPFGKETYLPGEQVNIHWDCDNDEGSGFNLYISTNNGGNWTFIANKAYNSRNHTFIMPSVTTNQALIHIDHAGTIPGDTSGLFTIAPAPTSLTGTPVCTGYASLSWPVVSEAQSYNIYKKDGNSMALITNTASSPVLLNGMANGVSELYAVSAVFSGGYESRRSIGVFVSGGNGNCGWDQDLRAVELLSPQSGRQFTSGGLGINEDVTVRLSNIGADAMTGFSVFYRINNEAPVIEIFNLVLNPGQSTDYTFSTKADLSATGTYLIEAGIFGSPDAPQDGNNSILTTIRHLENEPIIVTTDPQTTFKIDFENAPDQPYVQQAFGVENLERIDFSSNSPEGRMRFFVTAGLAHSGSKALSLDARKINTMVTNEVLMTLNMTNYSMSDQIFLHFNFTHHNNTPHPEDKMYIRGNDQSAWVELYNWAANQPASGVYKQVSGLNITQILAGQGQTFSASTQFRIVFRGNQNIINATLSDGMTIDDIVLQLVNTDVAISQVVHPVPLSCGLTSSEQIVIRIANTTPTAVASTQVFYRINGGPVLGSFTTPPIAGNSDIFYTLPPTDLSGFSAYNLDVWVQTSGDNVPVNDTISNYLFRNSPVITQFPYREGFEEDDGHWFTGGTRTSWVHTSPTKAKINRAANGNKVWTTGIYSHSDNEYSYLMSPCLDFSQFATNPVLSFALSFDIEVNYDAAWVEISEDGDNWYVVDAPTGGYNWYNNTGRWDGNQSYWHVSTQTLYLSQFSDKSKMRLRFVMYSDAGVVKEGIAIDDIHIYPSEQIYAGANTSVTATVSGNNWVHLKAGNQLVASIHPHGNNLGQTTTNVYFNPTSEQRHDGYQYYLDRNFTLVPSQDLTSGTATVRLYFRDTEVNASRQAPDGYDKPTDAFELGVTQISSDEDDGIYGNEINSFGTYHSHKNTQTIPIHDGYYIEFDVSHFSEFYLNPGLQENDAPLPISSIVFHGVQSDDGSKVNFSYKILANAPIHNIVLERSRTGDFRDVEQLKSFTTVFGTHIDQPTESHRFYYRLKVTEPDGLVSYSKVLSYNFVATFDVTIHPNVSSGDFKAHFTGLTVGQPVVIQLYNMFGKVEYSLEFIARNTSEILPFILDLKEGVYVITSTLGGISETKKLIIKK